ncbi:MAG: DUF1232 domain-containing protein [Anaerolineales bacterium]|jgi:uncharacterized membrane protein YkvA (DUF1232 family)
MKEIDILIQEDIAGYEGLHEDLIYQAPALYRLMIHLLDDPNVPGRLRPLVITTIAYFVLPADIMPEDLQGPSGYIDDIFLCAFIADRIHKELKSDEILTANWDGKVPILTLIEDVLSQEKALIGDKRELILWYIGYEHLSPKSN